MSVDTVRMALDFSGASPHIPPSTLSDPPLIGPLPPAKPPPSLIGPLPPAKQPPSFIGPVPPTLAPPSKPTPRRESRDVTKMKRYRCSLSFILSSVNNDPAVKDTPSAVPNSDTSRGAVNDTPSAGGNRDTSRGAGDKHSETQRNQSRVINNEDWDHMGKENFTGEVREKECPAKPASKRPCPYKLKRPILKKTTSRLFAKTTNNYLKGCKWAPDGLALATCSRDKILRIFNVPDLSSGTEQAPVAVRTTASIVYDYAWNPAAEHLSARSCNMLTTCKDSPIHMLNTFTGDVMGSYTAFNNVEVLISAFSVCYMSPTSILGGYCKHARLFDASRPGRESTQLVVGDVMYQNNNSIVAALAKHPGIENVFGAGCYNATLALYSTQMQGPLMSFYGPQHGVTQIIFSKDGTRLYCGSRMESQIYCFDTRHNGHVLHTYTRDVQTNQRIQFDINNSETMMVSGNHDGRVSLYDLSRDPGDVSRDDVSRDDVSRGDVSRDSCLAFEAHSETVNSVSFHPFWGLLATASGKRHFHIEDEGEEENSLKIWAFEQGCS